jgi:hypothetical protein
MSQSKSVTLLTCIQKVLVRVLAGTLTILTGGFLDFFIPSTQIPG